MVAPSAHSLAKPDCSTSHFAHRSGVKTAPIGLTREGESRITAVFKVLNGLDSPLGVSSDALVVFYGKVGEYIVKDFDVPVPLNLVPNLVNSVVEPDLACAQVFDAIAVLREHYERGYPNILQVSCIFVCRRLVVAELGNDELAFVIRQKLEKVADSADSSVGVLCGVEVLRFDINSDDSSFRRKAEVENGSPARQVNRCEAGPPASSEIGGVIVPAPSTS